MRLFCILSVFLSCNNRNSNIHTTWDHYGGSPEMIRYSSLNQIDTNNVSQLKPAWQYSSNDADTAAHSQIQCNPIIVNGILYGVSPQMKLFALNAATGKLIWTFNPISPTPYDSLRNVFHIIINSRGVTHWTDGKGDERIFYTAGSRTFAIDAKKGNPIPSFGDSGSIDLHNDLDRDIKDLLIVNSSPGVIYNDLLILGSKVNEAMPAAPGHIRAYDVRTGKRKWIFHTIPHPGEEGYETWEDKESYKYIGGANAWSGFSLDKKRGILFVPTGSAAHDFYGGNRKGQNLFANCLIALDAGTGKKRWHFQFMHHDLWDKDLPTPPALVTIQRDGKNIDAVAQPTKNGMLYLFERTTGKPLFDIREVPVDTAGALPGEEPWPTQPIPVKPEPYSRQTLTEKDINPYLPDSSLKKIREQLAGYRYGNMFLVPGQKPSLIFPGFDGGAEWGGPAFDPETGFIYINANEMAWIMEMQKNEWKKSPPTTWSLAGKKLYSQHCQTCHGADLKGTGNNPGLTEIEKRFTPASLYEQINNGRRMMPSFRHLQEQDKSALIAYLLRQKKEGNKRYEKTYTKEDTVNFMPYTMKGYTKFLSPEGLPAISPPWGTLNAIDLNKGELAWKIPLGEYETLKEKGIPPTGTENYGGPVVTAGGIVFIAATRDAKIRAFHKRTGKLLWEYTLPAPGFATPSVYEINGKQYLVIACGGGKLNTRADDTYLAFSL